MTKLEYLKYWLEVKGYAAKAALQSFISIQLDDEDSAGAFKKIEHAVFIEDGKFHAFIDGKQVTIEGDVNLPFYHNDDFLKLPAGFHPVLQGKNFVTTFGLLIFNIILFWEVFGKKVPYVNEEFTSSFIKKTIERLMVDNPKEGETVPEDKASVDDCLKFTRHCNYLEGLGTYFVKPGGIDALTASPKVLKRKEELFAQLKKDGKLNDPVAFTKVIKELVDLDREEMLNGPSANFFINDKFISNARKRMFIAFGIEPKGDGWVGLSMSLDEGMDPNEIVAYINTAVAGSYSRSMSTGEGGAQVKGILKLVGRRKVGSPDCGTKLGESRYIHETFGRRWIGSFYCKGTEGILITKDNLAEITGKTVLIRSPAFCAQSEGNYCVKCCGEGLGKLANRLSAEVVRIPTAMMTQRMKAAHTAGASTVVLDLETAIK